MFKILFKRIFKILFKRIFKILFKEDIQETLYV